jgi:hypothetical protein
MRATILKALLSHILPRSHLVAAARPRSGPGSRWIARREGRVPIGGTPPMGSLPRAAGRDLDAGPRSVQWAARWERENLTPARGPFGCGYAALRNLRNLWINLFVSYMLRPITRESNERRGLVPINI